MKYNLNDIAVDKHNRRVLADIFEGALSVNRHSQDIPLIYYRGSVYIIPAILTETASTLCGEVGNERTGKTEINNWLTANSSGSISDGRVVNIPSNDSLNFENWYAFEGNYGVQTLKERDGLTVIVEEDGSVVNEDGRYWVAVGPKVFNPEYPNDGKIWAGYDGLELETELDIKVRNENAGEFFFIYAVAGDIKAHTYGNGIVQTGTPYPNSWNATHEGYVDPGYDRSSIEFIRSSDPTNMNQYSIVEIIVKDR